MMKGGELNHEEESRQEAQVLSPQTTFELLQMRRKLNGILVQLDGLLRREKIDKLTVT